MQKYSAPPMTVAHEGGIFTTATLPYNSSEAKARKELNRQVIKGFGLVKGVTHTEFIRGKKDGVFYFLETAACVGGANIAEFIEAATSINLWVEWQGWSWRHRTSRTSCRNIGACTQAW